MVKDGAYRSPAVTKRDQHHIGPCWTIDFAKLIDKFVYPMRVENYNAEPGRSRNECGKVEKGDTGPFSRRGL